MALLTVQKSVDKIGNRFDLVLIASFRARQIQLMLKKSLLDNKYNYKPTILALKEIESGLIDRNLINNIF